MRLPVRTGPLLWRAMAPIGHRGYDRVWRLLDRIIGSEDDFHTVHTAGGEVDLPAFDPYWNRFGSDLSQYEPELLDLLVRFRQVDFGFLDGGANLGLWSVIASGPDVGARTVAVEASGSTYSWLRRNAERSGDRFATIHAALTGDPDVRQVRLSGGSHAGRSIVDAGTDSELVPAITLSEVIEEQFDPSIPIVIKLDVEGMEPVCLRSLAAVAAERGIVVAYEDHGKDGTHESTVAAMELDGSVLRFDGDQRRFVEVEALAELDAIKIDPRRGYNFFFVSRVGALSARLIA